MNNFRRFLDLQQINYEIKFDHSKKKCMVSKISIAPTMAGYPNENSLVQPVTVVPTAGETFQINNTKLYAPVVNLSTNDNIKFVENRKQGY